MPWIESHQELRNHPKTRRLAKAMKISVPTAIGHLHCLWWWATDYAPDGDLTEYEDWEIADAAFYEGKNPDKFKSALISAGFLDNTEGKLLLHDWEEYGGKNIKRQKAANERNRRYRERKRTAEQEQDSHKAQEGRTNTDENDASETGQDNPETETGASRDGNETVTRRSQDADTGHDMTRHDNININTFCAEPGTAPRSTQEIAASFILNDGSMYNVTENDVVMYQQLYPGIDCRQELRNITGWCDANPKNRKTRSGAKRFINSWLAKAQNRARPAQTVRKAQNRFNNFEQREYDYNALERQFLDGGGNG